MTAPQTVPGMLAHAAATLPDRRGWACGEQQITFAQMRERVDRLATGLLALGLRRGDRIALNAPGVPEWVEVYFAAATIGAVVVGLNVRYRTRELSYMLRQSGASMVVTIPELAGTDYLELVEDAAPDSVRHVVTLGPAPGAKRAGRSPTREHHSLDGLRAGASDPEAVATAARALAPSDPVMIIYTSGTTGDPKGAVLTHGSQLAAAHAQARHCRMDERDVMPVALPLNHVGGLTCGVLSCLVAGACCVLIPAFGRDAVHEAFARFMPTIWVGVPTMHTVLLSDDRLTHLDRRQVRLVITGGSNSPAQLLARLRETFAHATVMNLYGASETSGAVVMTPWESNDEMRVASVGRAIGESRIEIVGPDGGALAPGETGEVWVHGPSLAAGYHELPDATAAAFAGGSLRTGDLGSLTADGDLVLRGRLKELIIQGGYNVYPVEVEAVLAGHPAVELCAGIGVPDPTLGEIGRYYVVCRPGAHTSAQELIDHCSERLADYKVPRQIVFRETLPLTPSGKVRKAQLRAEAGP